MSFRKFDILRLQSISNVEDPESFAANLIKILFEMDEDIEKIKKEIEEIKDELLKNEKK